jgi:hypothetical protein
MDSATRGEALYLGGAVGIAIRLVGGPADGRSFPIPDEQPPPLYLIPTPPPLAALLAGPFEPAVTSAAEYEPLRDSGWPRRADDGAYLYGHRPAPVTAEERRALEDARREKQAAEEKRAAELDETWDEIRKERPGFPADWRDLFG